MELESERCLSRLKTLVAPISQVVGLIGPDVRRSIRTNGSAFSSLLRGGEGFRDELRARMRTGAGGPASRAFGKA